MTAPNREISYQETAKTPEWLSEIWNNPTKTTLSETVFAKRLAEVQAMKGKVSESLFQTMLKPFWESFDAELEDGIAITSVRDLQRIERYGFLSKSVDFSKLRNVLQTNLESDDDLGKFRMFLKKDDDGKITLKQNNSFIGDLGKGMARFRNYGIGNFGTRVSYEVDFRDFPKARQFDRDAAETARLRDQQTFQSMLANVTRTNPEPVRKTTQKREAARREAVIRSHEEQAGVTLPVVAGQKVAIRVPTAAEIKTQIDGNPQLSAAKQDNKFDVVAIQKLVWDSVPSEIQSKYGTKERFADGILGQDTANAIKQYVAQSTTNAISQNPEKQAA